MKKNKVDNNLTNQNASSTENIVNVSYSNSEETINATFDNNVGTVTFTEEKLGTNTLSSAISGSGARYTNADESLVFWEHQGEVTISKDGKDVFIGKINEEKIKDNSIINTWVWKNTKTKNGDIITPKKDDFAITFNEGGRITSTTDCNNIMAEYKVEENNKLTFNSLASTKMYCQDTQENIYAEQLNNVISYKIDGNNLMLNLKDGEIMNFAND